MVASCRPTVPCAQAMAGLPSNLEIAVGHGDRRLLVAAWDVLGRRIAAVIDHRLVDTSETGARHGETIFKSEGFENVHHEIGAPGRSVIRGSDGGAASAVTLVPSPGPVVRW